MQYCCLENSCANLSLSAETAEHARGDTLCKVSRGHRARQTLQPQDFAVPTSSCSMPPFQRTLNLLIVLFAFPAVSNTSKTPVAASCPLKHPSQDVATSRLWHPFVSTEAHPCQTLSEYSTGIRPDCTWTPAIRISPCIRHACVPQPKTAGRFRADL